jgi:hypothetical protein
VLSRSPQKSPLLFQKPLRCRHFCPSPLAPQPLSCGSSPTPMPDSLVYAPSPRVLSGFLLTLAALLPAGVEDVGVRPRAVRLASGSALPSSHRLRAPLLVPGHRPPPRSLPRANLAVRCSDDIFMASCRSSPPSPIMGLNISAGPRRHRGHFYPFARARIVYKLAILSRTQMLPN